MSFPNEVTTKGFVFVLIFVFLSPFIIAIAAIVYLGSANESKVRDFLETNSCEDVYNYKGTYKALCKDEVIIINDYFFIDFESNETIKYTEIQSTKFQEKNINVKINDMNKTLYFATIEESKQFFKGLQTRWK